MQKLTHPISPALVESPLLERQLQDSVWTITEAVCHQTTERILNAFIEHKVGEEHFFSVSGYGHDDLGREVMDKVFAQSLQAEAAIVRPQIVSGTHAIATALRGLLKPGAHLVSLTGHPYDTLEEVIGIRGLSSQSLIQQGVHYHELNVFSAHSHCHDSLDFSQLSPDVLQKANVFFIQRSRGYSSERPSLTVAQIASICQYVKDINPEAKIIVDNCYGEFTEPEEPTMVGADLIAGSLIKNPGGGIVPTGGYIAGKQWAVQAASEALTCPGIGPEGGYTFDLTRTILQGLFMAPMIVKEAVKGMQFAAKLFSDLGLQVSPSWDAPRSDIIQLIHLETPERLIQFCTALQQKSPVHAYVSPEPDQVPGYESQVVMAGGTFIEGATIELSADGPLRPPYTVFLQGGLNYAHTRLALLHVAKSI